MPHGDFTSKVVEQMLLGKNGDFRAVIDAQTVPAHPHLHVGPDEASLQKETKNRFKYLEKGSQTTGFLYPGASSSGWKTLVEAMTRAFNSYIKTDTINCVFNGGTPGRFSCVLDLSAFNLGRARVEEASTNGVRYTVTREEDVEAHNFFLLLVKPPISPLGYLSGAPVIQTIYPTAASAAYVIRRR